MQLENEAENVDPDIHPTRSLNGTSRNLRLQNINVNVSPNVIISPRSNPKSTQISSTSDDLQHHSETSSSLKQKSKATFFGTGNVENTITIPSHNTPNLNSNNISTADIDVIIDEENGAEETRRNNLIEQQMAHAPRPGLLRRTLHSLCGEKRQHSPQKKKPRGKGKKTKYSESRIKNVLLTPTLESMSENQKYIYYAEIERASAAEAQLEAEKLISADLRQQNENLQANQTLLKTNNDNLLQKIELLEAEKKESAKKREEDDQKIKLLEAGNRELKRETLVLPKLRKSFAAEVELNKQLNAEIERLKNEHIELQKINNELQELFNAMEKCTKTVLEKPSVRSHVPKARRNSLPQRSFVEYKPRTQRFYVTKSVNDLETEPLLKEKVLARLIPKVDEKKPKMSALQALAAAVLLDFNQNQIEKLKTLLRLLNMDVLPPITTIRTLIKTIRQEYDYTYFQDEERKIYVRVATSIEQIIKLRVERWLESGKFVFIPGHEDCVLFGIGGDQGGKSKKYVLSLMNVPKGHSSPNNCAVFGVAIAPKDDYETTQYCFQQKFNEINALNGIPMEFKVGDTTKELKVFFIVSCDGKECCTLSGHCGASSSNPCPTCECTKQEINEGKASPLRDAARMMEQAANFQKRKEELEKPTAKQLTELRKEAACITKPPICTIPKEQWIYGELHAVGGPVFGVLNELEDKALKADLEDLKITVLQNKDKRKICADLQKEISLIKSYIAELEKAVKLATLVKPKWNRLSKNPAKSDNDCCAKYCVMDTIKDKSTQSLYLKCSECDSYVHATCDLLFISYEIKYAEEQQYLCPECDPISDKAAIEDFDKRVAEWQSEIQKLKQLIVEKEKQKTDASDNIVIPYERCLRYQKIQQKLKELKIRKSCHPFQALKGVDVRKLVKNADSFVQALDAEWQEPAKTFFDCMNVYQELAEPIMLSPNDINRIDKEAVLRSYRQICGPDIPLKVHDLTTHTPNFMQKWGFYQLASDQPVEHVHFIDMKLKMRNPGCKQSPAAELETFTNAMSIRNKLFDLGISAGNFDGRLIEEKRRMFEALSEESHDS